MYSVFERGELPRWLAVRQRIATQEIERVEKAVAAAFTCPCVGRAIQPGTRVAITAGSRGIDRISSVLASVVAEVKRRGGLPFIVPAMGSHGGATAAGQTELLAHYGITEETVGAPIRSSMETVCLGELAPGVPVYFDRIAATEADAVIPVGRVKPHTDFHGDIESGLCKMIAIGLGKQKGADTLHNQGFARFAEVIPAVARFTLSKVNIPFGVALVENGRGRLAVVEVVPGAQIPQREPQLLRLAREMLPRLPGDEIDVLVIDYIGKDISGIGADTNVVNRYYDGPLPFKPRIQRLVVRDLTEDTNGNAVGLGLADVALRRAVAKVDPVSTNMNCITAKTPEGAHIPLTVDNDRQALYVAFATCVQVGDIAHARIARIRDTKHLETFYVSEPLYRTLQGAVEALEEPHPITFDGAGMFTAPSPA